MNEVLITNYVAVWGWQMLSVMFLCFSLVCWILVSFSNNLVSIVFAITFLILFIFCEYKSIKRKGELYNEIK